MDINQPSRLRTYSQLKLLLALNQSLDPELRDQISTRLEKGSLNPMENDLEAEPKLAQQQYDALMMYASSKDGLAARLQKDRRSEMVKLEHGTTAQVFFRVANILSFGKYVHREKDSSDLDTRLDVARRLDYHTNFLREVSRSGPQVEVKWNLDDIRRSLQYISEHGSEADTKAVKAMAGIFAKTNDVETRRACLETLARITNSKAHAELMRIMEDKDLDPRLKNAIDSYVSGTSNQVDPLTSSAKSTSSRVAQ
jgi:hypothetical protein